MSFAPGTGGNTTGIHPVTLSLDERRAAPNMAATAGAVSEMRSRLMQQVATSAARNPDVDAPAGPYGAGPMPPAGMTQGQMTGTIAPGPMPPKAGMTQAPMAGTLSTGPETSPGMTQGSVTERMAPGTTLSTDGMGQGPMAGTVAPQQPEVEPPYSPPLKTAMPEPMAVAMGVPVPPTPEPMVPSAQAEASVMPPEAPPALAPVGVEDQSDAKLEQALAATRTDDLPGAGGEATLGRDMWPLPAKVDGEMGGQVPQEQVPANEEDGGVMQSNTSFTFDTPPPPAPAPMPATSEEVEPLLGSAASAPRSGPDSFPLESVDGEASEDGPMMTPKRTRGDAAPVMMMQDGGDGDADAATREGYVVLGSAMMAGAAAAESAVPPQESMNTAGRDPPAIEPIPVSGDETPIPPGVAVAAGVSEPGPTLQGLQTPITQGAGIVTDEPMADGVQDPSGGVTENKHVTASTKDEYGLLKSHAQETAAVYRRNAVGATQNMLKNKQGTALARSANNFAAVMATVAAYLKVLIIGLVVGLLRLIYFLAVKAKQSSQSAGDAAAGTAESWSAAQESDAPQGIIANAKAKVEKASAAAADATANAAEATANAAKVHEE